jgi:hypothetical protein
LNGQRENKIYSAETPGRSLRFKIEITPIESDVIKESQNWRYAAKIETRQISRQILQYSPNRLTVVASSAVFHLPRKVPPSFLRSEI